MIHYYFEENGQRVAVYATKKLLTNKELKKLVKLYELRTGNFTVTEGIVTNNVFNPFRTFEFDYINTND
jgi:hypothetical protein